VRQYLDAFSVDDGRVHLEDGRFDGSRRRQFGHSDVDGVGSFGVQDDQLFVLNVLLLFLSAQIGYESFVVQHEATRFLSER
jgi:hypothetical protein